MLMNTKMHYFIDLPLENLFVIITHIAECEQFALQEKGCCDIITLK